MNKRSTGKTGSAADSRLGAVTPLRGVLNRVFPDHWSFLLGEIALYSFVVLAVTGTLLALLFDPSMEDVVYDGSYTPLQGTHMSAAYASALDISFDVRGGLLMRQMHHWAALLFMAAIVIYLLRVFFTGAFRKPRKLKWTIGLLVFWTGLVTGYTGYMMMDDGMSGTGMQILQGILLSIPVAGTWLASSIFGGEFPGDVIIGRMYLLHVLLLPGILAALMLVQIGLRLRQKPIQWPDPRRRKTAVEGERMFPRYAMQRAGLLMFVFAVIALLGGMVQVNPVWLFGPARAADVSALSQPAWYVMFLDGAVRLMPPWELTLPIGDGYAVPPIFWAAVVLPGLLFAVPMAYPFIEARVRRDNREHHLLVRPRDAPTRTALGAMAVTFYLVLTIAGAGDVIALTFNISTNAMTWAGRLGLLLLPPLAYWITHRICLGLQQHDRQVLAHGVETGIIRRLPHGGFTEIHQPLATPDHNGHTDLRYAGRAVPKKMNQLGALAPAVRGFLKPIEGPADLGPGVEADEPHRQHRDAA
ncbi:cytochrome bc complex cytochrome b subunit [Dactylosporangium fulvum]|uniref:Cytochrome bc1 complex cytochrome b subunit n=1 Tax=Dactylosporangium fulvum TaxID=53359 RepID=A0ABY5WB13_9ACTN|nr:cytochrome bc complex cytochrome b subunit [Dactylosporangium fulvum]UWP86664.1 cytochrome bc complex cytochrome b subunit [Dactylosporangium fulvum]